MFQVYEFGLNGPIPELMSNLSRGKAIAAKINPGTVPVMLAPVIGGEEQMTVTLIVAYPTLDAYAAAATKTQNSQEYAAFQASSPRDTGFLSPGSKMRTQVFFVKAGTQVF